MSSPFRSLTLNENIHC